MTIDDENSIYVGGLPYDATEKDLRRVFDLYGGVLAVKLQIINDREVGGKCFGFVTFTNPRSATDAISEMNGTMIRGRVIRVNEVRTRGGRPNFHRENFHRDVGRDSDRDRDDDYIRDRDRFRDRNNERSRDRDRDRDYARGREFERPRDHAVDRARDRSVHYLGRARDYDKGRDMDWDQEQEMDTARNHDEARDTEQQSISRLSAPLGDRQSRELSLDSNDEYQQQVKEDIDVAIQRSEDLQKELELINGKADEREQAVSDLQKKCQKLEDTLAASKKLTSQRQSVLAKLNRCFLQTQDYSERLKSSEQELKILVDSSMAEVGTGEEAGDGSTYANGQG